MPPAHHSTWGPGASAVTLRRVCLQALRAMRQTMRNRRQAAAERVEPVQTETVVVESAHVMVVVVRQDAVEGFNTRVSLLDEFIAGEAHFQFWSAVKVGRSCGVRPCWSPCLSASTRKLPVGGLTSQALWQSQGFGVCIASACCSAICVACHRRRSTAAPKHWKGFGPRQGLVLARVPHPAGSSCCLTSCPQSGRAFLPGVPSKTKTLVLRCRSWGGRLPSVAMQSARDAFAHPAVPGMHHLLQMREVQAAQCRGCP